jgi:rhodanese-related sulfurtransferase
MKTITTEQLRERIDDINDVTVINTLPEESFEKTKIEGSINIPQELPDFTDRVERVVRNKDAEIVVYCASARCDSSSKAAEKLERAGFTNVYEYEPGAEGWQRDTAAARR